MRRRLRNTGMSGEAMKKTQTANFLHRVSSKRASVQGMYSDGTAVAHIDTGPYTYQYFQIGLVSKIGIAGKTIARGGKHYVKTANLHEFIEKVDLVIDGTPERSMTMPEFIRLNGYRGLDVIDGFVFMEFGGPNLFTNERQEDAYMLGTANVNDLRLQFELSSDWDETNMKISLITEYAPVSRPLEWIETHKTQPHQFTAAGPVVLPNISVNSDLSGILITGEGITSAKLIIDDQTMFEGDVYELQASCALYGNDTTALGDHVFFDFWRGAEATKGLMGLRSAAQRKRNADITIELELENPNTELVATMLQCGRYATQN